MRIKLRWTLVVYLLLVGLVLLVPIAWQSSIPSDSGTESHVRAKPYKRDTEKRPEVQALTPSSSSIPSQWTSSLSAGHQSPFSHDWAGNTREFERWLIKKENHYSGGVVTGVPCADSGGFCRGGDRMSSKHHRYAQCYAKYLHERSKIWRSNRGAMVAEIGILKGSGLALWSDLFSERVQIHGFDKVLSNTQGNMQTLRNKGAFEKNNLALHELDQLVDNRELVGRLALNASFLFVIDDGLHTPDSMIHTFDSFQPYLSKDFLYVLEDLRGDVDPIQIKRKFEGPTALSLEQCPHDKQFW
eukprot:CAMPEP_0184327108 /NCGR_PEP_ID=MMETSP1049-20130417/142920_1 /TAXON_ID=77928 /ORGANISM="Proteomonas sulcata, Strain CCMP704" /LENGTH=299 /DNA_ID=CAMNT_0026649345 /DNA_START=197 /DNA_END=1093 /DNA_ORIENTATION=+